MRLTLRTLLAYRDRVLSAGDREDLHARVQKSEPASNLLRRIDAVATRKNLTAPPPIGSGLGSDANSVSEYLDDAMPAAQVPEMEVVCLNSDVQLGELAHCHSILSTAVEQKIDVPHALYDRVLKFKPTGTSNHGSAAASSSSSGPIMRVDKAHVEPATRPSNDSRREAVEVTIPMVASAGTSIAQQGLDLENSSLTHEIPQYLVGSNRGAWIVPLAIGGLLALLCVLLWQTLGPWDRVAGLFNADNVPSPVAEDKADTPPAKLENKPVNPPKDSTEATNSSEAAATPANTLATDQPDESNTSEAILADQPKDANVTPQGSPPASSPLGMWSPADEQESSAVVLMRDASGLLSRLQPSNVIGVGSVLVMPDGMNTTIVLPGGLQATNMGDSVVRLADAEPAFATIDIQVCQWMLTNIDSTSPHSVRFQHAGRITVIELAPDSAVTLEASSRRAKHDAATQAGAYKPVRVMIALNGSAVIRDSASQDNLALQMGDGVALVSDDKPRKFELQRIPNWLRPGSRRPIDRLAATDLNDTLAALLGKGQTIAPALEQIQQAGRPETAAAAARCSILLGDLSALATILENQRCSPHWTTLLNLANRTIARQSNSARESLIRTLGDADGSSLFSRIVGPESASADGDAITDLIAGLESQTLTTRVLSIYHLQRITGTPQGYLPHRPNRESVAQWRRDLTGGRIKLAPTGDLIPERNPL